MKMPLMINKEGAAVVIGGGNVGMHKLSQLSKFNTDIILIDRDEIQVDEIQMDKVPVDGMQVPNNINTNINVKFIRAELKPDNIASIIPEDAALVISALEDRGLNALVAEHCNAKGILINVVDDPELSTVFFTAFSKKGDITVSVTTSGQCPFLARKMREKIDDSMDEWDNWLKVLAPIRCGIDGIENKNRILTMIYENDDIRELVKAGKIEEAKMLAKTKVPSNMRSKALTSKEAEEV